MPCSVLFHYTKQLHSFDLPIHHNLDDFFSSTLDNNEKQKNESIYNNKGMFCFSHEWVVDEEFEY